MNIRIVCKGLPSPSLTDSFDGDGAVLIYTYIQIIRFCFGLAFSIE